MKILYVHYKSTHCDEINFFKNEWKIVFTFNNSIFLYAKLFSTSKPLMVVEWEKSYK